MGVYAYQGFWVAPNLRTEPAGTAAGNVAVVVPPGIWTGCQAEWTGSYTGNWVAASQAVLGSSPFGSDPATIPNTPKTFDVGPVNAPHALSNVLAHLGKQAIFNFNFPSNVNWGNVTYQNLTLFMTGQPFGSAPVAAPVERLIQIAPNLFFETPEYPPLDLQPEAGPVSFPDPQFGPGSYTDVFDPFGNLKPGAAGLFGNQKVRGQKRVACLRRKGHVYLNIAQSNLPAIQQINLTGDSQWLKFTPGLANLGASAGNGNLGIRIYAGLHQYPSGIWTVSYSPPAAAPDWCGNGSFADLFPWERPLQFAVELTGLANIPASSLFEFCLDGFDLG